MGVLRLYRRAPPSLPLMVFGPWEAWIAEQGEAAACPIAYVAGPLLAAASALIGNARWPQAGGSWSEPPHIWVAAVGDSGTGKSPGADGLLGKILPVVEHNMRLVMDISDRVVVVDEGRMLAEGLPPEVGRNPLVIEAYLGSGDDGQTIGEVRDELTHGS